GATLLGEGKMTITYVKGDATCPQAKGVKIICHVCNDLGGWGKGFVLAVSKRWKEPEANYRAWHAGKEGSDLGPVRFVRVEPRVGVATRIGQHGMKRGSSGPPVRYGAIAACLGKVAAKARELKASVHVPRIGCGLAGGEWSKVEPLIEEHLAELAVTV